jgi:hypothetical protein
MQARPREQVVQEVAGAVARRMKLVQVLVDTTELGVALHAFWERRLAGRFNRTFATPADLGGFLRDRCIELDFEVCDLSRGFQEEIAAADAATLERWYRDAFGRSVRIAE